MAEAPDYSGGYVPGSTTVAGGGGYDPTTNSFTSDSANSIGGSKAISSTVQIGADFRGGYAGEATFAGGGGFDPNAASGRNLGGATNLLKPDGTKAIPGLVPTSLTKGSVDRVTGLLSSKATDPVANGKSQVKSEPGKLNSQLQNFEEIENPLDKFASYVPIWTFACLTKEQFNNPRSYRNSPADLKFVVFSSAGRYDQQRVKVGANDFTAPEYFINNFEMRTIIAPTVGTGNSNAVKFEFEVFEPYSMGQFLQSMQVAAQLAGHQNYLNDAPFLMKLDFKGFDDKGLEYNAVKSKYYTLQLLKTTFQVNESGSTYRVEATVFNHKGFAEETNMLFNDTVLIAGEKGTVEEVLKMSKDSLITYLNKQEEKAVQDKRKNLPDIYDIQFPERSSDFIPVESIPGLNKATTDPAATIPTSIQGNFVPSVLVSNVDRLRVGFTTNDIGGASFGFNQGTGGNFVFKEHGATVDPKTGIITKDKMAIDPKKRTFQFSQGQSITAVIDSVIQSSLYAVEAMKPEKLVDGFIKWYRIDVQIEMLNLDTKTGSYQKKYTFRVVPYLVHHSVFVGATGLSTGLDKIQKKVNKVYNYIYTGQNNNIIRFDIEINNAFFTGISPQKESQAGTVSNLDQSGPVERTIQTSTVTEGNTVGAQFAEAGKAPVRDAPNFSNKKTGGIGDAEGTAQKVAETFNKALHDANNADLIKVDLEILGDPYWMADSGMGNYFANTPTERSQVTDDGSVNYEVGDVHIYISFRTPIDINETTGLYDFPTQEIPYSGLYKVLTCDNLFQDGVFKQKLNCVRMPAQANDYPGELLKDQKVEKQTALAVTVGAEEAQKSSITGEVIPRVLVSNPTSGNSSTTSTPYTGPVAPDYRGGYAGEATFAGGGGYDPATGAQSNNFNSIGGAAAISPSGTVAPSFAGGYVPGAPTVASGGGYDPATNTFTSDSANSIGGSRAIT
jgi:hypothetical protein